MNEQFTENPPAAEFSHRALKSSETEELPRLLHNLQVHQLELEVQNLQLREAGQTAPSPDLYDSAPIGYVDLDEQGIIQNINLTAAVMLGKERSSLLGQVFGKFIAKKNLEKFLAHLQRCRKAAQNISLEINLAPPDREPVEIQLLSFPPTDLNKKNCRLALTDVTEIKRAERKILQLAAFPRFNPNPVMELSEEGALLYFNEAARQLAQTLGSKNPAAILPPQAASFVLECLASEKHKLRHETVIAGHHLMWSFFSIVPGRVVHCYATDITERLKLEEQLRQSQKMESIGQLASGVAHDFNNILTIIQGYTSLLLTQRKLPPEIVEPIKLISAASERAANLTRQLLSFSPKQVLRCKPLDLNEVIRNLSSLLRRLLVPNNSIEFDYAPHPPAINADRGMIEQIIMNLALNARDAMNKKGLLTLSTALLELNPKIAKTNVNARSGPFVCLTVSDTGCGMDRETLNKIFDPFFTTKDAASGLGLATVYGSVQQHQGWIEVKSEVGQGSVFKIFFPAIRSLAPEKTPSKKSGRRSTETILVVEDDATLRKLLTRQLVEQGYKVVEAESGAAALAVWPEHSSKIDLLFTDIVLSDGLTGPDLAETLLLQKPELRVIYTSGYSLDVVEQDFSPGQGIHFLQKPYNPATLAKVMRDCLEGKSGESKVQA